MTNKKYWDFGSISRLTVICAAKNCKNFHSSNVWACLHDMVILRSQNKITYFFTILARLSRFSEKLHILCAVFMMALLQPFCLSNDHHLGINRLSEIMFASHRDVFTKSYMVVNKLTNLLPLCCNLY